MILANTIVALLLLLQPGLTCKTYVATRHNAFDQVFRSFPERFTTEADGFGAEGDCSTIGQWRTVIANEHTWKVKLADCHKAGAEWGGFDLDSRLWWASGLPNAPTKIEVCKKTWSPPFTH